MLWIFLLSLFGAFIQRTIGFGFGIFVMTVFPLLLPTYGEATMLSGLLALVTNFTIVCRNWRYICWQRLWLILIVFLLVSSLAIVLLPHLSDANLRIYLGIMLLLVAGYFAFCSKHFRLRPTNALQIGMGCCSGIMGGWFAMQGPPAILYFIASEPTKQHYLAMTSAYFLFGNLFMTLVRLKVGFFTDSVGCGLLIGLPAIFVGTWVGSKVFQRISEQKLRYAVYAYIALAGILLLLRG